MRSPRALAAVAVVYVAATACGADGGASPDDLIADGLIGAEFYQELSQAQKAVLEDGRVDFVEYEEAVFAFRACMENSGVVFDHFELTAGRVYEYAYGRTPDSPLGDTDVAEIYDRCAAEHISAVELLWQVEFAEDAA